jgi:hypothetical protein
MPICGLLFQGASTIKIQPRMIVYFKTDLKKKKLFVSDLWQVGGFLWVLRFPPPIKLTAMI